MFHKSKKLLSFSLAVVLSASLAQTALAAIKYMPDVTAQMSEESFWADYHKGYTDVILTPEEIK